jgi:hypothetical protein
MNYFKDRIVIEEISITNPHLGIELESPLNATGNWNTLLQQNATNPSKENPKSSSKTILVKRLILNNVQADMVYRSQLDKIHHLPIIKKIVLKDITESGKGVFPQIAGIILKELLKESFTDLNLKDTLNSLLKTTDETGLKDTFKQLKSLLSSNSIDEKSPSTS